MVAEPYCGHFWSAICPWTLSPFVKHVKSLPVTKLNIIRTEQSAHNDFYIREMSTRH